MSCNLSFISTLNRRFSNSVKPSFVTLRSEIRICDTEVTELGSIKTKPRRADQFANCFCNYAFYACYN